MFSTSVKLLRLSPDTLIKFASKFSIFSYNIAYLCVNEQDIHYSPKIISYFIMGLLDTIQNRELLLVVLFKLKLK